jgi:predicted KAP-like P-loop ATPase
MLTNDTPIATPDDDQFGVDPFARALARAVSQMAAPKGAVIAINGPWGCGKSSALNLVLFHVDDLVKQDKLKIIRFSPWWMSGPDAITAAFFSRCAEAGALGSARFGSAETKRATRIA